jgi:exopolysaccharide biosynthesis polyprenyl glycosylphosphotransferase
VSTTTGTDWRQALARRLVLSDLVVLLWVFVTAHVAWAVSRPGDLDVVTADPYGGGPLLLSALLLLLWLIVLTFAGTREALVLGAGPEEYKRVVTSTVAWFAIVAFASYMMQIEIARSYVAVLVVFGLVLLLLSRWAWRQWLLVHRRGGLMSSRTVVVGTVAGVEHLIDVMGISSEFGYRVVGACVPAGAGVSRVGGVPVLGSLDDVMSVVTRDIVDAVIVTASDTTHPDMVRRLGWDLEEHDVQIIVAPSLANVAGPRVHVRPVAGLPLLHVEQPAYRGAARYIKAVFDFVGGLVLLLVFSPVLAAAAAAIRLSGPGPVFFRQERVGRGGRTFEMIKLRSMVVGAEQMIGQLDADAGNAVLFKMRDDPRVTRVGRILRRTSIDELPQLLNVVKGDMSLVGPRPPLASEVCGYEAEVHRRLLVRPGMTGPWQVSGRSELGWEESVRLDLYYVENWSIVGDLLILWKTLRAVVSTDGAY